MMRAAGWIMIVLGLMGTLFCGYCTLFWGWVTATPLTPQQLARAQYNTYFWFALAVVSFLISIGGIVIAVRQKRKTASGFDVVTTG